MPFSSLPTRLADWPALFPASGLLRLGAQGAEPVASLPDHAGILVLMGRPLAVSELAPLAARLGQAAVALPPFTVADVEVLVLLTSGFDEALGEWLKAQEWSLDAAYVRALPDLTEPGLLLMDMDSTAIQIECIDEIARLAGVGEQVAAVTAAAMQGKLEFCDSLRNRVALLKDADAGILEQVVDLMPLMPGLETLVARLKQAGWKVAIASGGFTRFAGHLQQTLGLDHIEANNLVVQDGRLTGEVDGRIVDGKVKAQTLMDLKARYGIADHQTVAIGDGANDLPMLANAALGLALHAKPIVRQQAQVAIARLDLEAALCLLEAGSRLAALRG